MSIIVTVLYPNTPGSRFDMDYYLKNHFDLVQEKWGAHGLLGAQAIKGIGTADPDTPAPFQVIALVEFESMEALQGAMQAAGTSVHDDIVNFTDVEPIVQICEDL